MESSSRLTLDKSFFDHLWPLILEENICDTHSKNTSGFFTPSRPFDKLWAHTLLAKKGYADYKAPVKFDCCQNGAVEQLTDIAKSGNLVQEPCTKVSGTNIVPLLKQIHTLEVNSKERQRLTQTYVHRRLPWYMQEEQFADDDHQTNMQEPLDMNVLLNLQEFNCPLLIIDMAASFGLHTMERWLKFCRHAQLLVVCRSSVLERQLQHCRSTFLTLLLEENMENSWQEELMAALYKGVAYAREVRVINHCAQPFIFIFASKRGMCTCDSFKVLRTF